MSTLAPDRADVLVESWLEFGTADLAGPAGPLFTSGRYAEYEITMTGGGGTTGCGWCSGSRTIDCY